MVPFTGFVAANSVAMATEESHYPVTIMVIKSEVQEAATSDGCQAKLSQLRYRVD